MKTTVRNIEQHNNPKHPARIGLMYMLLALVCTLGLIVALNIGDTNASNMVFVFVSLLALTGFFGFLSARAFLRVPNQSVPPEKIIGTAFAIAVIAAAILLSGALVLRRLNLI
jgi:fumarate reductase subunit C